MSKNTDLAEKDKRGEIADKKDRAFWLILKFKIKYRLFQLRRALAPKGPRPDFIADLSVLEETDDMARAVLSSGIEGWEYIGGDWTTSADATGGKNGA